MPGRAGAPAGSRSRSPRAVMSQRFGHDLDFPAFDLRSASEAESNAERGVWVRRLVVGLLLGLVSLLGLGSPLGQRWPALAQLPAFGKIGRLTWTAAATPWRLVREPVDIDRPRPSACSRSCSWRCSSPRSRASRQPPSSSTPRSSSRSSRSRSRYGDPVHATSGTRSPARRHGWTIDAWDHPPVRADRVGQSARLLVSLLDFAGLSDRRGDDGAGDGAVDRLHDARVACRGWLARQGRRMPRRGGRRMCRAERPVARLGRRAAIARSSAERRARYGDDGVRTAHVCGRQPRRRQGPVRHRRTRCSRPATRSGCDQC